MDLAHTYTLCCMPPPKQSSGMGSRHLHSRTLKGITDYGAGAGAQIHYKKCSGRCWPQLATGYHRLVSRPKTMVSVQFPAVSIRFFHDPSRVRYALRQANHALRPRNVPDSQLCVSPTSITAEWCPMLAMLPRWRYANGGCLLMDAA